MTITIVENDVKSFQNPMEDQMDKAVKHFDGELIKIRTGRAHTSLIEEIPVSAYGQPPAALKTLAALTAADVRLLTVQPWDPSIINDIEKAIQQSDLGVTPVNDGKTIKLVLPEMSTNRRDELIKILGKKAEECKTTVRNIRKDFKNALQDAKKNKTISEDFFNRLSDVLQSVTDKHIKAIDAKTEKKTTDIKTI